MAAALLPGSTVKLIDSVGDAIASLGVKLESFASNPSLGTFLQIGGTALKAEIAKVLPTLTNGVKIAGQDVKDVQALDAIDPSVFQAIVHANIASYVTSAGAVDISLQADGTIRAEAHNVSSYFRSKSRVRISE